MQQDKHPPPPPPPPPSFPKSNKMQEEQLQQLQKFLDSFPTSITPDIPVQRILCYLCQEPITFCIETICGHAYCQYCLSQYLLVTRYCPICGERIREKKWACNKRLDQFVEEFCSYAGKEIADKFKEKKEKRKSWKQERQIVNAVSGALVDVRDEDHIWQKGRIIRTFNRLNNEHNRIKFLVVQYLQTERKEQFSISSLRLAKPGYFTNRDDIPLWNPRKMIQNQQQNRKSTPTSKTHQPPSTTTPITTTFTSTKQVCLNQVKIQITSANPNNSNEQNNQSHLMQIQKQKKQDN